MKILNFGSLNIDNVYSVEDFVKRGETISSTALNIFPGGKGLNQSLALGRAGVNVCHAGRIGEDGGFLEKILRESGVDTGYIKKDGELQTGHAIIQKARCGDNCIILHDGANGAVTKEMVDEVLSGFECGDGILLQNEISEVPYIVEKAHEKGMKIILNPSPMNRRIFEINLEYIQCLILNESEAKSVTGDYEDSDDLIRRLQNCFPNSEIVLTLGERGSVFIHKGDIVRQKAYTVEAVDTTAAGDTFTGYYLAGRFMGKSVELSLEQAAKASAIAVTRPGAATSIPYKDEVIT